MPDMPLPHLMERLQVLLASQRFAVLATDADGQPYTSLVSFAAAPDLRQILFVTGAATRKYAYLVRNPRVSLLIDNRSNRDADLHQAAAVTALGRACRTVGATRADLLALYLERHPYLDEFARSPSCELIAVRVQRYIAVERFQHVTELVLEP